MVEQIYITSKTERLLAQMAALTNAPAVAAQRARMIIDYLINGITPVPGACETMALDGGEDGPGTGLLRYKKDRRVKNCLKFNLGQGYRLICIKEKKKIYVMFVGDHDSSDAWLDHFTKKRPHKTDAAMVSVFTVTDSGPADRTFHPVPDPEDVWYDPLPPRIPQEMLRRIFRGLCAPG